ncbi:MAG: hypothetical protein KAY37_13360 [Phycisphaerae bacterium]|nr:hypothetical protein [Phycisphaerae bacterium]
MLNELLEIDRGLRAVGIEPAVRHGDIKPLAKRDVLCAQIDETGVVTSVRVLDAEHAPKFWTIRDGNHNSFPLVPLRDPLRTDGSPDLVESLMDQKRSTEARVGTFHELWPTTTLSLDGQLPWPSYRDRLRERRGQLDGLRDPQGAAVLVLFDRVLSKDGRLILETLDAALANAIKEAPVDELLTLAGRILFAGGGEVLLDIAGTDATKRDATSPRNVALVSEALAAAEEAGTEGRCGLTGRDELLEDDKFPQANLPLVGPTYLIAKNEDTRCTARYGISGSLGMPVARRIASRLQAAAEALGTTERKGKTWSRVPSDRPKQFDLLFAYVPRVEELNPASALAENAADFEELARRIIELSKGRDATVHGDAHFYVIRKLDRANKKIIYTTTSGVGALARAAECWTAGCRNVPPVELLVPGKQGQKALRRGPGMIAPGSLVALGRQVYMRGGEEYCQAPGPTFADAMRLFLGDEHRARRTAMRLLGVFIARHGVLLAGVGHAQTRGFDALKNFDRRAALETITVLGLLLHTLGRNKKEKYMNDTPYQLGQLLAGADVLHRGYCEHQRGGSIPTSLIGSQALAVATRRPSDALAMLLRRWRVYDGWAKKNTNYSVDDKFRGGQKLKSRKDREAADRQWAISNAVRVVARLRPLAEALHEKLPVDVDDIFRAELLLGYIAGPPKRFSADSQNTLDNDNTENMEN